MRENENEYENSFRFDLARESFAGHTWTYELLGHVLRDGRYTGTLFLIPEPFGQEGEPNPTRAVESRIYTGTAADVRDQALRTIQSWIAVRPMICQHLGVPVPQDPPAPRRLTLLPSFLSF